eukprot:357902-Chlamydomonas_euryale.AAC.13
MLLRRRQQLWAGALALSANSSAGAGTLAKSAVGACAHVAAVVAVAVMGPDSAAAGACLAAGASERVFAPRSSQCARRLLQCLQHV